MRTWIATLASLGCRFAKTSATLATLAVLTAASALAQPADEAGGEAALKLPDLSSVSFLGMNGHRLLMIGLLFCVFGLGFGMAIYMRLKNLPVHRAMREVSELIYETCKTYLVTQGKFLMLLWAFIAVIIVLYFGVLRHFEIPRVLIILVFSSGGNRGQLRGGVVWNSREHLCQLPNGVRFAAGQTVSRVPDSARGRHVDRHDADLGRTADHALHSAVHAGRLRGPMLYRIRDRRVAGCGRAPYRRRHLHQDCRYRLPT